MLVHISNLISSKVLFSVSGVIFWWLAARYYSVEQVGTASALISACSLILYLAYLPLAPLARFLPGHRNQKAYLFSSLIFSVLCLLAGLGVSVFFLRNIGADYGLFVCVTLFMFLFQNLEYVFISLKNSRVVLIKNLLQNYGRLVFVPLFVSLGGAGLFCANGAASAVVSFYLCFMLLRLFRELRGSVGFKYSLVKQTLSFAGATFIGSLALTLPGMIFPVMVVSFFSKAEAGYFYLPWMIFSVFASCIQIVCSQFLVESSHADDINIHKKKTVVLLVSLAAVGVAGALSAGKVVLGIFHAEYADNSGSMLNILFYSVPFFALNQFYLSMCSFYKQVYVLSWFNMIRLLLLIFSAVIFVPFFASFGVTYAWLLSNVLCACYVLLRFTYLKHNV